MGFKDMLTILAQMTAGTAWKQFCVACVSLFAVWYPDQALQKLILASIGLLVFDFIVGLYASIAVRGEKLESRKVLKSAMKLFVYVCFPVAVWRSLEAVGVPHDGAKWIAALVCSFAVVTELLSLASHCRETGLFPVPKWLIKMLEDKAKELGGSKVPGKPKES